MIEKIKRLISKMTLEEKAGLCSGKDTWRLKSIAQLGIPEVAVSDGPHGLRKQGAESDHLGLYDSVKSVCFPAACATAASFDEVLLENMGSSLGEACRAENIAVLLGPAMNIKRSPLCGRNFEYFSEDPFLSGKLAAAQIKGIQKWDVGTAPKHFAANNQEFRRSTNSSEADDKTLREIYLSGFEIAVKEAKPWTMMCSYNKINGVLASENPWLLTDVLRNEWGFEGFVMSDWGAVDRRVSALSAGLDLEMPYSNGDGDRNIIHAVKSGILNEAVLDRAVERILNIIFRYADSDVAVGEYSLEEQHKTAVKTACECAVLLKNNGALPLNRKQQIAYIGAFAKAPRYQGGGSSHINAYKVTDAVSQAKNKQNITYIPLFDGESELTEAQLKSISLADAAIVFAGLPDLYESEGYDREHMRLPEEQNRAILKIASVQPNTVVVLHIGSPVEMPWIDKVNAVLCIYLAGEGAGEATDALLYGDANPCGKLPETFPFREEDTPTYLTYCTDEDKSYYSEKEFVGYRYYNAKKIPVLFPFGYGLSYTDFEYNDFRLSSETVEAGASLCANVTVKNIGKRAGKEAVQFYVHSKNNVKTAPVLKGFKKVYLEPGESKTVTVELDYRAFQQYNTELSDWYCCGGEFEIYAAKSSRDLCCCKTVNVCADKEIPFIVTRDTTLGKLLSNPVTKAAIRKITGGKSGAMLSENTSPQAQKAIQEMIANAPLRALVGFSMATSDMVDSLVNELNRILKNNNQQGGEMKLKNKADWNDIR